MSFLLLLALLVVTPAAADDWALPGWSHRAVVHTGKPARDSDVAAVRIVHQGLAQADGNDYRIIDQRGNPVPYEVTYHDPQRDSLISFRVQQRYSTFTVYFGNPRATVDPQRAVFDPGPGTPGSGSPKPGPAADGWIPRAGLVLTTLRRPTEAKNPETVAELAKLIADSPGPDGAGYRDNIRDGFNPFGDSDYYISLYRGWLDIPQAGAWSFCTASNEASFSFINGKELVHWPGRHTEQRGKYGEKNATVSLSAGRHYVEYYHEEVLLYQIAFLGVRGPGQGRFDRLPRRWFPEVHETAVVKYETSPGKTEPMIRPVLIDSVWPSGSEGQFTRYRLAALGIAQGEQAGWTFTWTFGDGQTAGGAELEHVFLCTGNYRVTLNARSTDGRTIQRVWPLVVYPIEHIAGEYEAGQSARYADMVKDCDPTKMPTPVLAGLVRLLEHAGRVQAGQAAAKVLLSRDDSDDAMRVLANRVISGQAGAALAIFEPAPEPAAKKQAVASLEQVVRQSDSPVLKLQALSRLVRLSADAKQTDDLYQQARTLIAEHTLTTPIRNAMAQVALAIGDVRLLRRDTMGALDAYNTAESLADPPLPPQVRAVRSGQYPERIRQALAEGRQDDALTFVHRWRLELPADQLQGEVFFWLGKVELALAQPARAAAPLELAVRLGTGSEFEAEARWLLAQAYDKAGNPARRDAALRALIDTGIAGRWRDLAIDALTPAEGAAP